jgi:hypothetical protein
MADQALVPPLDRNFGPPPDDPNSVYFYLFLVAAMVLVVLFCCKKFQEFSVEESSQDYVSPLLPRFLASRDEYVTGLLIYGGAMVLAVSLLSLLNADTFRDIGVLPKSVTNSAVPLIGALLLIGILPNVPVLQEIEKWLRRYAHERAFIPSSARAMADRLAAADFDFSAYSAQEVLLCAEMRGVDPADFAMPRRSLEHSWAKLTCVAYELDRRRTSGELDRLDVELLRRYSKHLDSIGAQRRALEADVAQYRKEKMNFAGYTDYALHRAIQDALYRLYILIGCAVRLNTDANGTIDTTLESFGFGLIQATPKTDSRSLTIGAMLLSGALVLIAGFAAVILGRVDLWNVSIFFPRIWTQPFNDATSSLALIGPAMVAAGLIRTNGLKSGSWFAAANSAQPRRTWAKYAVVAGAGGAAGYAGSVIWGLAFQKITPEALLLPLPYLLLAAAISLSWVYNLDNAKLGTRHSWIFEIAGQSIALGICGFVGAAGSFILLIGDQAFAAFDWILLTTATYAAIGGLLAWYIPRAAATRICDPRAKATEERFHALESAAVARFGDRTIVAEWLEKSQPALGGRSPRSAAGDVEGFEHALSLLHGSLA